MKVVIDHFDEVKTCQRLGGGEFSEFIKQRLRQICVFAAVFLTFTATKRSTIQSGLARSIRFVLLKTGGGGGGGSRITGKICGPYCSRPRSVVSRSQAGPAEMARIIVTRSTCL